MEEAKANGIVTAGDFVELVKQKVTEDGTFGLSTMLDSSANSTGTDITATALSDTRIAILHNGINSTKKYLTICEINNTEISVVANTELTIESYKDYYSSIVALSENEVIISYYQESALCACVCKISDTQIELGTQVTIHNNQSHKNVLVLTKINENKAFLAFGVGYNHLLYGAVLSVNKLTITSGVATQISAGDYSGEGKETITLLNENKIFIAYGIRSARVLSGAIIEINEIIMTVLQRDIQLISATDTGHAISAVALSESKVIVFYNYSTYKLSAVICSIKESIKIEANINLLDINVQSGALCAEKLSDTEVYLFHTVNGSGLYALKCTVNDDIILSGTDLQLSANSSINKNISTTITSMNKIFIAYAGNQNNNLYGIAYDDKVEKRYKTLADGEVAGVAKQKRN